MYKKITLLTVNGEKQIPFLANAATAIRYRQVFHTDLMSSIAGFSKMETAPDKVDWELPGKLGYVMNSAAEGVDMNQLSDDGYMNWLEQFEGDSLWRAQDNIISVYLVNQSSMSTGKK